MKFDPDRVRELYEETLTKLGIPLDATKATMEHAKEVIFLTSVSQDIMIANQMDITFERRKQLLQAVIEMDEAITTECQTLAEQVVNSKYN